MRCEASESGVFGQKSDDLMHDVDVLHLVESTYIIYLAHGALTEHEVDGSAVVAHV